MSQQQPKVSRSARTTPSPSRSPRLADQDDYDNDNDKAVSPESIRINTSLPITPTTTKETAAASASSQPTTYRPPNFKSLKPIDSVDSVAGILASQQATTSINGGQLSAAGLSNQAKPSTIDEEETASHKYTDYSSYANDNDTSINLSSQQQQVRRNPIRVVEHYGKKKGFNIY